MGHAFDQAGTNRVDNLQANDRNGRRRPRYRGGDDAAFSHDHVRRQSDQFRDVSADQLGFGFGRPIIQLNVGALDPSQILQRFFERRMPGRRFRVTFRKCIKYTYPPDAFGLLRKRRRNRPCCRRTAHKRDEFASLHRCFVPILV